MNGDEVIQLYIRHINAGMNEPVKQMKDFRRVTIEKGAVKKISLSINSDDLKYWDEQLNDWTIYPGDYEIQIGSSSGDIKLTTVISVK